ncbi:MAG: alkylhydroperoxidase-related (seleno)protein, partial [Pseudomonadales bacterium]|nr:alkylhydroperoxidase-related (seleno)protein [Pseudomonadales bacterium]
MTFSYTNSPYPIREDITQAHQKFWQKLAQAGSWWSGAQRIAIAAEVRNAVECKYCQVRKSALSPYTTTGKHKKG